MGQSSSKHRSELDLRPVEISVLRGPIEPKRVVLVNFVQSLALHRTSQGPRRVGVSLQHCAPLFILDGVFPVVPLSLRPD